MKITWYGHSCFRLESADGTIVFDPSENGRVPGYSPLPEGFLADRVLCSHDHFDHNAAHLVSLTGKEFGGRISFVKSWHDDAAGAKRGSNLIAVVETEGLKAVHLGDLGCELDDEQSAAIGTPDVLMIPVGGFYTIDSKTARAVADKLGAKVVIPMHYSFDDKGYDVISTLDEFKALSGNIVQYDTNCIEVTADTHAQTAIPAYIG